MQFEAHTLMRYLHDAQGEVDSALGNHSLHSPHSEAQQRHSDRLVPPSVNSRYLRHSPLAYLQVSQLVFVRDVHIEAHALVMVQASSPFGAGSSPGMFGATQPVSPLRAPTPS